MLRKIDDFLNNITMYRLVLYYLIFLLAAALVFSMLHILSYNPIAILFSTLVILLASWITNEACAGFLKVPANSESVYITALILALIISPSTTTLTANLPLLLLAAMLSQASKYILNLDGKHIFNPAALAVAVTALAINQSASWWVGTLCMAGPVLLGGLLVIRKVQRFDVVLAFLAAAYVTMFALERSSPLTILQRSLVDSPVIFFAAVMLTEPLTMPPTRDGRMAYGILVGWMFAPQTHLGNFYFTPELALLAGNVFSYIISPKGRYNLRLREKFQSGAGIWDFVFENQKPFKFEPGQYMEWTLGHKNPDSRGNRRYFTIASSPTEPDVLLGVRFYGNSSSFKREMLKLQPGDRVAAGQLAGEFTMPKDKSKKLVFVAGGIGITPFRSMLKFLADTGERRDVVMLYTNRSADEFVYTDVLAEAAQKIGARSVCALTGQAPEGWQGLTGRLTPEAVAKAIPDFRERVFYISGSHAMVEGFKDALKILGVPRFQIKTDFFPGLA